MRCHPAPRAPEQPHKESHTGILAARSRYTRGMEPAKTRPNLAAFVAHLATSLPFLAAILPPLPPITRNVKLSRGANRLECGIGRENAPGTSSKSGKNGNVDRASQHCRS